MGAWGLVAGAAIAVVAGAALLALVRVAGVARTAGAAVRRPRTWMIGAPAFVAVLALGVPWVYVQATETAAPPPLRISDLPQMQTTTTAAPTGGATTTSSSAVPQAATPARSSGPATTIGATTAPPTTAVTVDGTYRVGAGSEARYGIHDNVMGNRTRVVGRTNQVTGTMTIARQTVTAAQVVVALRTVTCGCVHDSKYNDLLDTQQYPTSQFVLTTPIPLASIPAEGVEVRIPVTGQLTIHGRTRTEHVTLTAARRGTTIAIQGDIPIALGDYGIEQPSAGPFGGINDADVELLIAFVPSA